MSVPSPTQPEGREKHSLLHQAFIVLVSVLIGAGLLFGAYLYWEYEGEYPSTDDATLQAHYVWVSPRISGEVSALYVSENQFVKAGSKLFQIDPRPFQAKLDKAQSAAELVAQINKVDAAAVVAAKAEVEEQRAKLDSARAESERVAKLVKRGSAPDVEGIRTKDAYMAAKASLDDLVAELDLANKTLGSPAVQQARLREARAAVTTAGLEFDWTIVRAPADGWVTRLSLRPGDVVSSGEKLFPFVESGDWWVQANFKETKVAHIKPGMPATVIIDSYRGRRFLGTVESIGSASAASFSLLPAQNTTGNWVKVTQRIPVRIHMQPMDDAAPYRMGSSCTVTIDTLSSKTDKP